MAWRTLATLVLLGPILLPTGSGQVALAHTEAEGGVPAYPQCAADAQRMGPVDAPWASGGRAMLFPEGGCAADYRAPSPFLVPVTGIRVAMTGAPGESYCGRFLITGSVAGGSDEVCAPAGVPTHVAASTVLAGAAFFRVTWVPAEATPYDLDVLVDYLEHGL